MAMDSIEKGIREEIKSEKEGIKEIKFNEFIGTTEIKNFGDCSIINNEQLAKYLDDTIPLSHLENCPSIEYDPYNPIFGNPEILGFYQTDDNEIHIADEQRFSNTENILDTVTHEIGHNIYDNIIENNKELSDRWVQLHNESYDKSIIDGTGFVSEYAKTNKFEDFAESYMAYIRDPEKLQIVNIDKYEFLHDYVFTGKEYHPSILAYWTYDSADDMVEVTGSGVFDMWGSWVSWQ